jgi:NAD-dependent SIR2 family protein deacetylase
MTANQRLIADAFRLNAETASTETLRQHAREQLAEFMHRVERGKREDKPSPFSRFVNALENEKSAATGSERNDHE